MMDQGSLKRLRRDYADLLQIRAVHKRIVERAVCVDKCRPS
jgi:aryl-alcohol dehydrogenase-like predicted oxidoreductase